MGSNGFSKLREEGGGLTDVLPEFGVLLLSPRCSSRWRRAGYLLSVFPILAVFAMFAGTKARERILGTVAIGLAALAASLAMTAVYHLGYSDFRSEKLRKPVAGDVV